MVEIVFDTWTRHWVRTFPSLDHFRPPFRFSAEIIRAGKVLMSTGQ